MTKRIFKPGDRVQLRNGGPVMEVMKYAEIQSRIFGKKVSDYLVECAWYDQTRGRQTSIFHQNGLIKVSSIGATVSGNNLLNLDRI